MAVPLHRAGQKTFAERAERHEADAEFGQQREDCRFRLAPPQRILALQGGHGLHRVRAADGIRARFRKAEISDLAGGNQILHRTRHLFHRHGGVNAVLVQKVDVIGIHAGERLLDHGTDALRAAVQPVGDDAVSEAELGGDHHFFPERRHRLAHQGFVGLAVGFGRVEKTHAELVSPADEGDAVGFGDSFAIAEGHAHAAQPQLGNFEPLCAQ